MRIIRKDSGTLTRYIQARKAADQAQRELDLASEDLLEELRAEGKKSVSLTEGDKVQRATFVQTETVKIDEDGLRKAVGVKVWNKITDRKVNKAKLSQVIGDGEISQELASGFLRTSPNKPYLRYTEGQKREDEDD